MVIKGAVAAYPPVAFVGWRFLIGGLALLTIARPQGCRVWRDGFLAGFFLFTGYSFQTAGLTLTGASNSALITGLFVVLTPLLEAILVRRLPQAWTLTGAVGAFAGVVLLSGGLSPQQGDLLTLGAAFSFAAHILVLSRFAHRHRLVPFTAVQLLVTASLALPLSALLEGLTLPDASVLPAMLLTALGVSAGAFLLQIWAQTVVGPTRAAMLLTLEPVFGVLTAAVVLGEGFDTAGWIGAGLIVAAIYLVIVSSPEAAVVEAEVVTAAH